MDERTVFLFDGELSPVSVCAAPVSLEYTELFCGAGGIKCVFPASGAPEPPQNGFIMCGGGPLYTVESVRRDGAAGTVTVEGRGILSLFSRRVVPRDFAFNLSPEECARRLVRTYALDALPALLDISVDAAGDAREIVIEAGNVLDRIARLVSSVSKGLSLGYDATRGRFSLDIGAGRDRRPGVAESGAIVLSPRLGSVCDLSETFDRSRYFNRVTVIGSPNAAGETESVTVDATDFTFPDSFDDSAEVIRETVVRNAVSVSLYTYDTGSGTVFDSVGFNAALTERGRAVLALSRAVHTFTAQLVSAEAKSLRPGDVCALSLGGDTPTAVQMSARAVRFHGGTQSVSATFAAL